MVRELGDGYYIVGQDATVSDGYDSKYVELKNILRKGDKEPLLDEWVEDFLNEDFGLLIAKKNKKYAYFNYYGQQIGDWYDKYGILDKSVAVGQQEDVNGNSLKVDIISAQENNVIGTFRDIISRHTSNNKIMVLVVMDGIGEIKCFDYVEKRFCLEEFENIRSIDRYYCKNFFCKIKPRGIIIDAANKNI